MARYRQFSAQDQDPCCFLRNLRYLRTMEENSVTTGTNVKISAAWNFANFHAIIFTASILRLRRPLTVLGNHPLAGALLQNARDITSLLIPRCSRGIPIQTCEGNPGRRDTFDQNYDGYSSLPMLTSTPYAITLACYTVRIGNLFP